MNLFMGTWTKFSFQYLSMFQSKTSVLNIWACSIMRSLQPVEPPFPRIIHSEISGINKLIKHYWWVKSAPRTAATPLSSKMILVEETAHSHNPHKIFVNIKLNPSASYLLAQRRKEGRGNYKWTYPNTRKAHSWRSTSYRASPRP